MTVSTRLKGKEGLVLSITDKETTPVTTTFDDAKSFELTGEDRDDSDLTFAEAAEGTGRQYTLSLTGITSFDEGSLWSYLWDNAGSTFDFVLGPKGNAVPSTDKPHFTFSATLVKPELSNEARTTEEGAEFEVELSVTTDVSKVTA